MFFFNVFGHTFCKNKLTNGLSIACHIPSPLNELLFIVMNPPSPITSIEVIIDNYFSTTIHDLLYPKPCQGPLQRSLRGDHSSTSDNKQEIVLQYKQEVIATCHKPLGLLFADVIFQDKKKVLFKSNIGSIVTATTRFSNASVKLKLEGFDESDPMKPLYVENLHENSTPQFWQEMLGSFPTRRSIRYKKVKYNSARRYFPGNFDQKMICIHVVNKGELQAPKRAMLDQKFTKPMNLPVAKNIGGRILYLRDVLGHKERIGMALIGILQTTVNPGGETKGNACRINGKPTQDGLARTCRYRAYLKSTGASSSVLRRIKSSKNSARLHYVNMEGRTTSFQISRFFCRHIFKSTAEKDILHVLKEEWDKHNLQSNLTVSWNEALIFIEAYLTRIRKIADQHFPYFVNNYDGERFWNETLDLASNITDKDISKAHLHLDTKSSFPAILSAMNPIPSKPWCGGELFVSNGGCIFDYAGGQKQMENNGDVIIIDGDQLAHSVLPIVQLDDKEKRDIIRLSQVIYNNGPRGKK